MFHQLSADLSQPHQPHVEDHGLRFTDQVLPVKGNGPILAMAGNEAHGLGMVTVGQRNTGIGGTPTGGSNPRHHLKVDAFRHDQVNFLTAAAKDKGVSPFQPAHFLTLFGVMDQQFVDIVLGQGVFVPRLAHVNQFRIPPRQIHDALSHQTVIEDHIGFLQQAQGAESKQVRVAGTGAHQVDLTTAQAGCIGLLDGFAEHGFGFAVLAGHDFFDQGTLQGLLPEQAAGAHALEFVLEGLAESGHQVSQAAPASRQRRLQLIAQLARQYRRGPGGTDTDQHRGTVHDGRKDEISQRRVIHHIHRQAFFLGQLRHRGIHGPIVSGTNDQSLTGQIAGFKGTLNTLTATLRHDVAQFCAHFRRNHIHLCARSVQETPFTQGHFAAPHQQGRFALQTPADWQEFHDCSLFQ